MILKVFRKVSPGLNPDIEVHSALAAAGSTHIAAPLGLARGQLDRRRPASASTASLAMAQAFLKGATEGWALATASVRDLSPRPTCTPTRSAATSPARRTGSARPPPRCTPPWPRRCRPARLDGKELGRASPTACASRLDRGGRRGRRARAVRRGAARGVRRRSPALDRAGAGAAGARRLPPRPGDAHRSTAGSCSTSRASRPGRSPSGAALESPLQGRRRACCGPSTTPPGTCSPTTRPTPSASTAPTEWAERNRDAFCDGLRRRPAAPTRATRPCCCGRSSPTRRSTRSSTRPATGRPGCRSRWRRSAGSPASTAE